LQSKKFRKKSIKSISKSKILDKLAYLFRSVPKSKILDTEEVGLERQGGKKAAFIFSI
jgi:hypothetical protein